MIQGFKRKNTMHPDVEEQLDGIDAAFFSGDTFHDKEALEKIEHYLARWTREVASIKKMMKDPEWLGEEDADLPTDQDKFDAMIASGKKDWPRKRFPEACMGRKVRVLSVDGTDYIGKVVSSNPNSFRVQSDSIAQWFQRGNGEAYSNNDRVIEVLYGK